MIECTPYLPILSLNVRKQLNLNFPILQGEEIGLKSMNLHTDSGRKKIPPSDELSHKTLYPSLFKDICITMITRSPEGSPCMQVEQKPDRIIYKRKALTAKKRCQLILYASTLVQCCAPVILMAGFEEGLVPLFNTRICTLSVVPLRYTTVVTN